VIGRIVSVTGAALLSVAPAACENETCDEVTEDCGSEDRCVPGTDVVQSPATFEIRDQFVRLDLVYEGCPDDQFGIWWWGLTIPAVPLELQHYRGDCTEETSASVWIDLAELDEIVHPPEEPTISVVVVMGTGRVGETAGTIANFDYELDGPRTPPPSGTVVPIDSTCGLLQF